MTSTVSIIIPVYNQEHTISECISSLKAQSASFSSMEILLVNDGSRDHSGEICQRLASENDNIIYIYQENQGVSAARNAGIHVASGKYLFFLDADDALEKHTIQAVTDFFDTVYDEVDLVTYPIETIYQGKRLEPHFRYQFLKNSGVYDLCTEPYIGQTTMNIAVKNQSERNILFDESQTFSEDQRYCCDVLHRTLKMGFCKDGGYLYYRDAGSSSGKLSGACYIFEQCMEFFEEIFSRYDQVPLAFQGLYVNDLYWKMTSNILFPYHYGKEQFHHAMERMRTLLDRCDSDVILNHPQMDFFEKFYLLRLKDKCALTCRVTNFEFALYHGQVCVLSENSMELVVTKIRVEQGRVELLGFIKSVFLQFYQDEVMVCAVENDGALTRKMKLYDSAHCYYLSREKTQKFRAFRYRGNLNRVETVRFEVGLRGNWFPTHFYFMPYVPLSHKLKRYDVDYQGCRIRKDEKNVLHFSKCGETKNRKRIWLYYDCVGVERDNGALQFLHDVEKCDDITRYYVVTDERQKFDARYRKHLVKFGSRKHKSLLEKCEKVLTAYIEESNIFPYGQEIIEKKADKLEFEVVYLQHGVLHIVMPWKYSPEKIMADKIVVSTWEEKNLYLKNGFVEKDLICTGMARFEQLRKNIPKERKILFAPSWRSYLTGEYAEHHWEKLDEKFLSSSYFKGIWDFLSNDKLQELLERHDYDLDVKLHPIFSEYQSYFTGGEKKFSSRIAFLEGSVMEESYSIFMTDFSSFQYDFLYLGTPVLSYIPDMMEFKCGMNGYRELDHGENFWENVAMTPEEAVTALEEALQGHYREIVTCHFVEMGECRERLYEKIMGQV